MIAQKRGLERWLEALVLPARVGRDPVQIIERARDTVGAGAVSIGSGSGGAAAGRRPPLRAPSGARRHFDHAARIGVGPT